MKDNERGVSGRSEGANKGLAILRAGLLVTASLAIVGYLVSITQGMIAPENRLSTPEIVLAAVLLAVIMLAGQLREHSIKDLTLGSGGVTASFERIQLRQDALESEVRALQIALTGLVTKFEAVHLAKLGVEGRMSVRFGEIMLSELTHLDAMQFIRPVDPRGLNALRLDHGSGLSDFDLKDYVEVTREGLEYMALRAQLGARTASDAANL